MPSDPHAPLREDIRMLGELLGETLRAQAGDALFEAVENVRAAAKAAREGGEPDVDGLAAVLRSAPVGLAVPIARAFSHFLTLANIAEQHHRVRRRRDYQRGPAAAPQPASCDETFARLRSQGIGEAAIRDAACGLRIELVLTAHPTAITRRTLVHKHLRIANALVEEDRPDLTPPERDEVMADLRRTIAEMWGTEDVRQDRPTPIDEVRGGLLIFEQALWDAVPRYVRTLDASLRRATGAGLPLDAVPVAFGSWIGGDRDGNPNVTADVTREACGLARRTAARLYLRDIDALRVELSMTDASPELCERVDNAAEPYRALLRPLRDRLRQATTTPVTFNDLLDPLLLCHRSLAETGLQLVADGHVLDVVRRIRAFRTTLVRLDIRQHARRHAAAVDAIARRMGAGAYSDWPEPQRQTFLTQALRDRLRLPDHADAGGEVRDVLETFTAIAELPSDELGAYVISMAQSPSDVLAVCWLQQACGSHLRVAPLFEEVETLRHSGETMRALLAIPEYRDWLNEKPSAVQEIMIGYSDSAKDGGRLAANWELYTAQEAVVAACTDAGVEVTLFHGRGGSIGRGGGPAHLALQSQPPSSVQGRLRATVQGEMIQAQFGLEDIAMRSLEVYTTGTLGATLATPAPVRPAWRDTMERLATIAHDVYREIVYDDPQFVEYFRSATPEVELAAVPIGSRPARRDTRGGVESLRAIPWVFAWTQTRLLLPAWLGTGEALGSVIDGGSLATLREMYRDWPFFRSTLGLIEMALAEAEPRIAAAYDRRLVPSALQPLGRRLRQRLEDARTRVLQVMGSDQLLEGQPVLRRSIELRNPYVDPINVVQIELLARLRAAGEKADPQLWRAFMVTVNGIAAGMRNVG